ncbi:uncharacterized protein LOC105427143 [Pogonomyrmex barbatus]|uniref:Uncharacterized protein LOC105427143 n=1 Tax=Pogonomyrmex barbatus TaxID=144034 RepID=A0A6I9WYH0_9HYME|nr:uncharacterized protein LOC105427143 [Pogonomyrmex barbatus]
MELKDKTKFHNYFRMDSIILKKLLELIGPLITRQSVVRESISSEMHLYITLRYLTSGDSMTSISYAFKISACTISCIIPETCRVLYEILRRHYLQTWNVPNRIASIDGKYSIT